MDCTGYRDSIHALIDGAIGSIRRAELQRHLDECGDCRALAADLRRIHDLAASLPALEPPDGVWLQVAGRLRQEGRVAPMPATAPRRRIAIAAIAAALVLGVGASLVLLRPAFRSSGAPPQTAAVPAPAPQGNATADTAVQSVETEFRLAEQHYQNAIAKLEQAAQLDRAAAAGGSSSPTGTIDPQTAATLRKNLQVIDEAIAESRAALRSEPASASAADSLFGALRRKVALLQDTIALMNEMRKGNSAGAAQIVEGVGKS
jgi:hypothetical protein